MSSNELILSSEQIKYVKSLIDKGYSWRRIATEYNKKFGGLWVSEYGDCSQEDGQYLCDLVR